VVEGVRLAKAYLTEAIRRSAPLGGGHGPVAHDWLLERAELAELGSHARV
jgi:hydroxymethylpyrimidine/phosphomethylpyrimidine kinase